MTLSVAVLAGLLLSGCSDNKQPGDVMRDAADSVSDGAKEAVDKVKDATN